MPRRFFLLYLVLSGAPFLFGAEDQATVTTFVLADGKSVEAIRFASAGEEGARTFLITTLDGERKSISESDIVKRKERIALLSELPAKAREQIQSVKKASAKARAANQDDAKIENQKNQDVAAIVRKEIEARIVYRKINDEWSQLTAEQAHYDSEIASLLKPLATADAEATSSTAALAALEQRPVDRNNKDAELSRESKRDTLRRRMTTANKDLAALVARREEYVRHRDAVVEKLKDLTPKKEAAQAVIDKLVAEKSKAIVASVLKKITPDEKGISTVKLADGTTIRAKSLKELENGILAIVDEQGKERRVAVKDIDVSE
jgi:chromosome segregation ATPase